MSKKHPKGKQLVFKTIAGSYHCCLFYHKQAILLPYLVNVLDYKGKLEEGKHELKVSQ